MSKRWAAVLFVVLISFVTPAFADEVIDGQFGPGALYRLVRPTVWNGSLVLYAHGALPVCAVAGGSRRQFDYLGNVRALFDFFYPGVLPGNAGNVQPGIDIQQQIVVPATTAMLINPAGAAAIAAITQTPVPFASPS